MGCPFATLLTSWRHPMSGEMDFLEEKISFSLLSAVEGLVTFEIIGCHSNGTNASAQGSRAAGEVAVWDLDVDCWSESWIRVVEDVDLHPDGSKDYLIQSSKRAFPCKITGFRIYSGWTRMRYNALLFTPRSSCHPPWRCRPRRRLHPLRFHGNGRKC